MNRTEKIKLTLYTAGVLLLAGLLSNHVMNQELEKRQNYQQGYNQALQDIKNYINEKH